MYIYLKKSYLLKTLIGDTKSTHDNPLLEGKYSLLLKFVVRSKNKKMKTK